MHAQTLSTYTHHAATGEITSNVRPVLASQRVIRGNIVDRDGVLLVGSEVVDGGFVRRVYPMVEAGLDPAAFSNLVGFFSTRFGQSGLEATYGGYLSGELGSPVNQLSSNLFGEAQRGNHLHLTINAALQARVSTLLAGRPGSVVVLEPETGAVLAMVSAPGFDPRGLSFNYAVDSWESENERIQHYWEQLNSPAAGQPLLNRPTQGQYAPGSTFKTVTAIAALENPQKAQPDRIECYNELPVESGAPPVVNAVDNLSSLTGSPSNLEKVYAYSCNVAFAQYALRLRGDGTQRPDALEQQAEKLGIYRPQEVPPRARSFTDLPTEASRLSVEPGFLDRPAAVAATGYGQGQILVTPLQMAMVAAAVANDGVLMQAYLVERVERADDGTTAMQAVPRSLGRVMSSQTARRMRDNMGAVGAYGFGSVVNNFVANVMIGGKSGTAELAPPAAPHAWFIAIAPVDDPRYAVSVMVEHGGEGSSVGATLAGQVLAAAFELEGENP
jgi:peptidoglycan glycosyltransferase